VRDQIKTFAHKKASLPPGRTKIIILDEADSLTEGAQHALRMIMSNFSETTRFVLSCNTSSKIIEPIQSRCIILRFSKLKESEVELNLKRVIDGENVRLTEEAFKTLLFVADGDMRQAINSIQACHFASKGKLYLTQDKQSRTKQFFIYATYHQLTTSSRSLGWQSAEGFMRVSGRCTPYTSRDIQCMTL